MPARGINVQMSAYIDWSAGCLLRPCTVRTCYMYVRTWKLDNIQVQVDIVQIVLTRVRVGVRVSYTFCEKYRSNKSFSMLNTS
jgi:hypothetical protein